MVNAGYEIIEKIKIAEDDFIVLGYSQSTKLYVTWRYDEGDESYRWGHYIREYLDAKLDMLARAKDAIEYQRYTQITKEIY